MAVLSLNSSNLKFPKAKSRLCLVLIQTPHKVSVMCALPVVPQLQQQDNSVIAALKVSVLIFLFLLVENMDHLFNILSWRKLSFFLFSFYFIRFTGFVSVSLPSFLLFEVMFL